MGRLGRQNGGGQEEKLKKDLQPTELEYNKDDNKGVNSIYDQNS